MWPREIVESLPLSQYAESHISGTLIGVLILAFGFSGLSILGAPTNFQPIFKGANLIVDVGLSTLARRYAHRV